MSLGPEELQSSVVCWSILENKARDSIKPLHSASPRLRVLCAVKAYTQSKHLLFLHHLTARRDLEGGGCPGTPPASAHCPKCVQLGAPGSPSPAGWRVASPGSEAGSGALARCDWFSYPRDSRPRPTPLLRIRAGERSVRY